MFKQIRVLRAEMDPDILLLSSSSSFEECIVPRSPRGNIVNVTAALELLDKLKDDIQTIQAEDPETREAKNLQLFHNRMRYILGTTIKRKRTRTKLNALDILQSTSLAHQQQQLPKKKPPPLLPKTLKGTEPVVTSPLVSPSALCPNLKTPPPPLPKVHAPLPKVPPPSIKATQPGNSKAKAIPPLPAAKTGGGPIPQKAPPFPKSAAPAGLAPSRLASASPLVIDPDLPPVPEGLTSRPVQWVAVPQRKISNSVWEIAAKAAPKSELIERLPIDELLKHFFRCETPVEDTKSQQAVVAAAAAAQATRRVASILDGKRSQNIEIALKGLGLLNNFDPIRAVVGDLDISQLGGAEGLFPASTPRMSSKRSPTLTLESLQLVAGLYPKPEEEVDLRRLKANAEDRPIAQADQFLLNVLSIPRFTQRIQAIVARCNAPNEVQLIEEKLMKMTSLLQKISESSRNGFLLVLLTYIRKCGNFVNCQTKKGKIEGFKIDFLDQLKSVRAYDNRTTLLSVIIQKIESITTAAVDNGDGVLGSDVWRHLNFLRDASSDLLEFKTEDIEQMIKSHRLMWTTLSSEVSLAADDEMGRKFKEFVADFLISFEKKLVAVETQIAGVKSSLCNLAQLYCETQENPSDGMNVIRRLHSFVRDIDKCREDLIKQQEALVRSASLSSNRAAAGSVSARGSRVQSRKQQIRHSQSDRNLVEQEDEGLTMISAIHSLDEVVSSKSIISTPKRRLSTPAFAVPPLPPASVGGSTTIGARGVGGGPGQRDCWIPSSCGRKQQPPPLQSGAAEPQLLPIRIIGDAIMSPAPEPMWEDAVIMSPKKINVLSPKSTTESGSLRPHHAAGNAESRRGFLSKPLNAEETDQFSHLAASSPSSSWSPIPRRLATTTSSPTAATADIILQSPIYPVASPPRRSPPRNNRPHHVSSSDH